MFSYVLFDTFFYSCFISVKFVWHESEGIKISKNYSWTKYVEFICHTSRIQFENVNISGGKSVKVNDVFFRAS